MGSMLRILLCTLIALPTLWALPEPPKPSQVAVIYNADLPESRTLAEKYAEARKVPVANLIGFSLPLDEEISRIQYETLLRDPLRKEFERREWWTRAKDPDGNLQIRETKIHVLCCMRGVPSRILGKPPEVDDSLTDQQKAQEKMLRTANSSVDSELTLLGVDGQELEGSLKNPYFHKNVPIREANLPLILTGRIDAHSYAVCERMILDAVKAEETGLWGFGVVDVANKFAQGDQWLKSAATALDNSGIPTLIDRADSTLPVNFPLRDTAIYYGWYDWNVSGPFTDPEFRFKRGAVAVHIHSFSASQLRNPAKNWCAPLLAKGAAATLGNTYEPLLSLCHHLDVFNDRLLAGYTLVEAAYMACPGLSWRAVVLGDPLYRPFLHLDGTGEEEKDERAYRALRVSQMHWRTGTERENNLKAAAERMKDGTFYEAIALGQLKRDDYAGAIANSAKAKALYTEDLDKLRMDLVRAIAFRESGRLGEAVATLKAAREEFAAIRQVEAVGATLNIINPPAPPQAPR